MRLAKDGRGDGCGYSNASRGRNVEDIAGLHAPLIGSPPQSAYRQTGRAWPENEGRCRTLGADSSRHPCATAPPCRTMMSCLA